MKQTLLLLCAIPCLLTAQTVTKNKLKEKPFFQQLVKNQRTGGLLMLRSGNTNLPDTIYTYWGEEKSLYSIGAIAYDDSGRRILEKGRKDTNGDGVINENDREYRVEFAYIHKDDVLETQEVHSVLIDDIWINTSKIVGTQKSPNTQIDYFMYENTSDGWFLWSKTVASGYNEKGLPIMYHDTTFMGNGFYPSRINLTYNDNDMYDTMVISVPSDALAIGQEWILTQKIEFTYDKNNKQEKDAYFEYDMEAEEWYYVYSIEYTYDDKGNLSGMKEVEYDGSIMDSEYYTNIYSSTASNKPVFAVQSAVYPNPVSDVLNITINGVDQTVITLMSANGSIVAQQKVQQSTAVMQVSSLAKGYYFLTVQTAQGTETHKVIIK